MDENPEELDDDVDEETYEEWLERDSDWRPLSIHLSQSEFLKYVLEELEEWDEEARAVREASVSLVDVNGEPTFVVEALVAFESGMTSAVRGKSDSVLELNEVFLRVNPSSGETG